MHYTFLKVLFLIFCFYATSAQSFDLIPYPDSVNKGKEFSSISFIEISENDLPGTMDSWLRTVKCINFGRKPNTSLYLDKQLKPNAYMLRISDSEVHISYSTTEGLRNAWVTLLQLYDLNNGQFPMCEIEDSPEFSYRGMHLDVCRHFFSIEEVKRYIDYLTYYKFNTFHWHLTEDQGWRIEIKAYPKLQEIAAYRNKTLVGHYNDKPVQYDGQQYGGYYSQEELKDVVAYAKSRGITIIPEIEMPGHAQAAIAAYPELGCTEKPVEVATTWGVFENVYCPKEETFEFLQNVLDEVIEIFPSEYIHIGGDECPKSQWKSSAFCQNLMMEEGLKDENELQSYFISRIADYLHSKGRKIIGWDEILDGGLADGATVMSWRGEKGGIEAAKAGHNVIMTPGSHCYFDHYQSNHPNEPLAIGGFTSVEKVYNYKIVPAELTDEESKYVLGAQGNVWTEYIPDFSQVQYMAMARMMALSEALFVDSAQRNYNSFFGRFSHHIDFWKAEGANIADHRKDIDLTADVVYGDGTFINVQSIAPVINHTENFIKIQKPNKQIEKKSLPASGKLNFKVEQHGTYEISLVDDNSKGRSREITIVPHKASDAEITLKNQASDYYPGSGPTALINGIDGNSEKYGGSEWLGFSGSDFIADIELPEIKRIDSVSFRFFNGEGQWIYLPRSVELVCQSATQEVTYSKNTIQGNSKVVEIVIPVNENCKSLHIKARNHGLIESGKQGAGHNAWLFVDEIRVE